MATREQRIEAYRQLPDEIKPLYDDPSSGALMFNVFKKYSLEDEKYSIYGNLIGDCILGFHKTTDLPRLFQSELGMSADEAQRLLSELLEFLSPVIKREEQETKIKKEDIDKLAKTFAESKGKPKEITPEGKPADVKPLRTMEGDINRAHGYGAGPVTPVPEEPEIPVSPVNESPVPQPKYSNVASNDNKAVGNTSEPVPQPTLVEEDDVKTVAAVSQDDLLKRQPPTPPSAQKEPTRSAAAFIANEPIKTSATKVAPAETEDKSSDSPAPFGQIPIRKVE